ncbi:MAG: hypothetical protein WCP85_03205 [Mariniphaga sp.]
MIRINKTSLIPHVLSSAGATETANLTICYNSNPNKYSSRPGIHSKSILKMPFDNKIYGHKTVKDQLILDQHGKCCFCESKFSDNSYGDVEHFRPKSAYKKLGSNVLTYPGYYWLAYDWNNLLFSCQKCNQKYKRNDFPLGNEATRVSCPNHPNQLSNEDRLLINPIVEDPSLFIAFIEEVPVPVNNSPKGSTSIEVYGLERLNESRLEYLHAIKAVLAFLYIDETNADNVKSAATALKISASDIVELCRKSRQLFNSAAKDSSKYAYCVRCKFPFLPTV